MAFIAYALLDEIEDHERNRAFTLHKSVLRDKCYPFDLSDFNFKKLYRLTKNDVSMLIEHLRPNLTKIRKNGLSVEVQVSLNLYYIYTLTYINLLRLTNYNIYR